MLYSKFRDPILEVSAILLDHAFAFFVGKLPNLVGWSYRYHAVERTRLIVGQAVDQTVRVLHILPLFRRFLAAAVFEFVFSGLCVNGDTRFLLQYLVKRFLTLDLRLFLELHAAAPTITRATDLRRRYIAILHGVSHLRRKLLVLIDYVAFDDLVVCHIN